MKKNLFNFFILICVITSMTTSIAFADVNQNVLIQKQQQSDMYTQQIDSLRQQTEYLRQQNEILRQQTESLRQNQAYNQGYVEGQHYYHNDFYAPGLFIGGLSAGYLLGHCPPHYYPHYGHHCW